jgi:hypothetical protein
LAARFAKRTYPFPRSNRIRNDSTFTRSPRSAGNSRVESSPLSEATEFGFLPPNGEQIALQFSPDIIDSSTLTISIDAPNGQHDRIDLDLSTLR